MRAVLYSINKPHTDNIICKKKTSELRTRAPKIYRPYKAYIYETLKNGGCGKVIGEFVCNRMAVWRMCVGVPAHLSLVGCVSVEDIWRYCKQGEKDITEICISNLVIYDKPKELNAFGLKRPPQSWCYVDGKGEGG